MARLEHAYDLGTAIVNYGKISSCNIRWIDDCRTGMLVLRDLGITLFDYRMKSHPSQSSDDYKQHE